MINHDRPVEAPPEVLAELQQRFDTDMDSRALATHAQNLGLHPPAEPVGYRGWQIVLAFPTEDYDNGVLYWLGPQEDHADD